MRIDQFEHVINAAAQVSGEREIVVIGSQAILGSFPVAPAELLRSMEVDLYPLAAPEKIDEIDAALGDTSMFHESKGYYAHGVGPETAKAPAGWEERLVRVELPARVTQQQGAVALCLEPHDLVLAKLAAGRQRDLDFTRTAIEYGIVEAGILRSRIGDLPLEPDGRERVRELVDGLVAQIERAARA